MLNFKFSLIQIKLAYKISHAYFHAIIKVVTVLVTKIVAATSAPSVPTCKQPYQHCLVPHVSSHISIFWIHMLAALTGQN